jgi:hypothetical protein
MAEYGFEKGWNAAGSALDEMRQGWNDASRRKRDEAEAKLVKKKARELGLNIRSKKKGGYWDEKTDLPKSSSFYLEKASEQTDPARKKVYEELAKESGMESGPLTGQYHERVTAETGGMVADTDKKKIANRQEGAKARQLEAVTKELGKSPDAYKRIAASQVIKGEVDIASTVAATAKTKEETVGLKHSNSVFIENNKANNALNKAESEARVKESGERLLKIQQEMAATAATSEKVIEHNEVLDDYSASVSEMIGRVSDGENVLQDLKTIRQAIAEMPTFVSGSVTATESVNAKRDALVAQLKVKEQELVSSKQFRIAKEKEANSVTAMSYINGDPKLKSLYKSLEGDPISQAEMEIPIWVAERLTDAGVPLGVMRDKDFNEQVMRVVPHPDPNKRHFPDGKGGWQFDPKTGKLYTRMVMMENSVMNNLDDFIGVWKAKRTPTPMVRDSLTTGGQTGQSGKIDIGLGSATPPPPRYQESMESSAAFREGKDIDFETYEGKTTGGEIDEVLHSLTNREEDNLATAVRGMTEERRKEMYDKTRMSKQWLDYHLDKPSTPETPLPYHSRSAAPAVSTPAAAPPASPAAPEPTPQTEPNESELRSLSGINEEQAKALDKLDVDWRDSKLSGPNLISNEISSASREVERIKGSIKEKSTTLKKGHAATKLSDLSGIGGTTSAVNLSPREKIALRKEIERDEIELKAREKKLIELQRLLSPRDSSPWEGGGSLSMGRLPEDKKKKETKPKPRKYRSPSMNPNLNPNLMPKKSLKATDKAEG